MRALPRLLLSLVVVASVFRTTQAPQHNRPHYSASADRIFVVGGLSAIGMPLTDVWWRSTVGDWQSIPVSLSSPIAVIYSRVRMRLIVLDRTPTALQLASIDPSNATRVTLASWPLPTATTRFALMNSLDGNVIVVGGTSAVGSAHDFRVLSIDELGGVSRTPAISGTLIDAFADRAGFGFLVEEASHMQRATLLDLQPFAGAPFP